MLRPSSLGRRLAWSAVAALPVLAVLDQWHALAVRPWIPPASRTLWAAGLLAFGVLTAALLVLVALEFIAFSTIAGLRRLLMPWTGRWSTVLVTAPLAAPLLFVVAQIPFKGTRFLGSSWAVYGPWLTFLVLVVVFGLATAAAEHILQALGGDRSRRTRWALIVALTTAGLAAFLFDAYWQAPWYPLIHALISLATALLFQAAAYGGLMLVADRELRSMVPVWTVTAAGLLALWCGSLTANDAAYWRLRSGTLFAARATLPFARIDDREIQRRLQLIARVPPAAHRASASATSTFEQVLLFTADTLRRDAVGPYRSGTDVTPALTSFFKGGVVFERAYSQYAATRHSVWTMFAGRYKHEEAHDAGDDNLITTLRDHGKTAVAVLPEDLRLFVNLERFNFSDIEFYAIEEHLPQALTRLKARSGHRANFIWVHAYSPHAPYAPPPGVPTEGDARSRYLGEVRFMDQQFAETLRILGPSSSRLVMFGADHGEEFGEHGATLHGHSVYEEVAGVPLLLAGPGVSPRRIRTPVANLDIAPTVLDGLRITPPRRFSGRSLLASPDEQRWIYSETVNDKLMAVQGDSKWIVDAETGFEERYDLGTDPQELRNLYAATPFDRHGAGRAWLAWFSGEGRGHLWSLWHSSLNRGAATGRSTPLPDEAVCLMAAEAIRRGSPSSAVQDWLRDVVAARTSAGCATTALEALSRLESIPQWACDAVAPGGDIPSRDEAALLRISSRCGDVEQALAALASPRAPEEELTWEALSDALHATAESKTTASRARGDLTARLEALLSAGRSAGTGDVLSDRLQSPNPKVRAAVVRLLARIRPQSATPTLDRVATSDASPRVRAAAVRAAYELSPADGRRLLQRVADARVLPDLELADLLLDSQDPAHADRLITLVIESRSPLLQHAIVRRLSSVARDPRHLAELRESLRSRMTDPEIRMAIDRMPLQSRRASR